MAIFLCNLKNITRSEGRSAVAAAAYRSGEKIKNAWDGVEHDYTRKGGIVYKNTLLPENAPVEYKDRSKLWNAVELAEKASDSRLCRECLLALPKELSRQEQIALVEDYVKKNFVSLGMCADIAIHDPILTDDLHRPIDKDGNPTRNSAEFQRINTHAHILLTVRPLDKNGRWEAKTQKEYLCKRGDKQAGFTADEFKTKKSEGWEKQYRYVSQNGKKIWMTPSEAAESGLSAQDRVSRSPRSTPHGRENPIAAFWNDKDRVVEWRRSWADMCNAKFRESGINASVDHRSYADQGIDRIPQEHMGSYAHNAEKRARRLEREGCLEDKIHHTEAGTRNRLVDGYNRSAAEYHKAQNTASKKVRSTAAKMERLRAAAIYSRCSASAIGKMLAVSKEAAEQKTSDIENCMKLADAMLTLNEKSLELISALADSLQGAGMRQRKDLQYQINSEQKKMKERAAYVDGILKKNGFADVNALRSASQLQAQERESIEAKETALSGHEKDFSDAMAECRALEKSVPDLYKGIMELERIPFRESLEVDCQKRIKIEHGKQFSLADYRMAVQRIDKALAEKYRSKKVVRVVNKNRHR